MREAATKFFRDHHRYSEQYIRELEAIRTKSGAGGFITTEKDVINLGPLVSRLGNVCVARVTMDLDQADAALDTMLRVIGERRRES